jgi:hypothetical protein
MLNRITFFYFPDQAAFEECKPLCSTIEQSAGHGRVFTFLFTQAAIEVMAEWL